LLHRYFVEFVHVLVFVSRSRRSKSNVEDERYRERTQFGMYVQTS